jgi:mRNA export factor
LIENFYDSQLRDISEMSTLFGGASAAATTNTVGDLKLDVQLQNTPDDSISDLSFNPNPADQKDFLAVASWDKKVRIYEILSTGQGEGKHLYEHDGPVFSCDFFKVSNCARVSS